MVNKKSDLSFNTHYWTTKLVIYWNILSHIDKQNFVGFVYNIYKANTSNPNW